jgi:hypothetical protein
MQRWEIDTHTKMAILEDSFAVGALCRTTAPGSRPRCSQLRATTSMIMTSRIKSSTHTHANAFVISC